METTLKSKSFKFLISFLGFLVQNLWPKNLNLGNNYPKSFINPNFGYFTLTYKPETPGNSIKGSKDSDFSLVSTKNFSKILLLCSWGL